MEACALPGARLPPRAPCLIPQTPTHAMDSDFMCVRVLVRVCARARVCVHACKRACMRVFVCARG